jgi:hypothetical protein
MVMALMAVNPAPVAAEYFFTQRGAEKVTKDAVNKRYGYSRYATGVYCRGRKARGGRIARTSITDGCARGQSRLKAAARNGEDSIFGQMLIVGHSGAGSYGYRVQNGAYCEDA